MSEFENMEIKIHTEGTINLVMVGPWGVGKSTFSNTLFKTKDFTENPIKYGANNTSNEMERNYLIKLRQKEQIGLNDDETKIYKKLKPKLLRADEVKTYKKLKENLENSSIYDCNIIIVATRFVNFSNIKSKSGRYDEILKDSFSCERLYVNNPPVDNLPPHLTEANETIREISREKFFKDFDDIIKKPSFG
ncbi:11522_t:CDS:2 [Diversispora eburnea]|uniref:11522_t:CDS:1 n=1 Tax=Diversispora eburnea TaxID=1213867 RepID=A0A9N9A5Q9_9GLOM|nr:11522_t:CDS:2 [Diversispora eburnea]